MKMITKAEYHDLQALKNRIKNLKDDIINLEKTYASKYFEYYGFIENKAGIK